MPWSIDGARISYKSLPGDEKSSSDDFLSDDKTPREYIQSLTRLRWLLRVSTFLLCLAAVAIIALIVGLPSKEKEKMQLQLSPVPDITFEVLTFSPNISFSSRPTPESERAWDTLLPPGRGFVFVADGEKYELQPGQPTPWGDIYSVSLFHQLHCLAEVRKYHYLMLDSLFSNDTRVIAEANKKAKHLLGDGSGGHAGHCFEYLRQGIMCSGDMTLEWPKLGANGKRIEVDGWEIPHVCKSWDAIGAYMQQNHFNWSSNSHIAPD